MNDKLRIAAIIVLGIAAIAVLVGGRRELECGQAAVREALVRQIGDRLNKTLGPGRAYELSWRPDCLDARAIEKAGGVRSC